MHGTRSRLVAIPSAGDSNGTPLDLGMFESIETGVDQDNFQPYILGRASPTENVMLGQAPIMVRLRGFRKVTADSNELGPYGNQNLDMNMLQELYADAKDLTIQIIDRQTDKIVLRVEGCKVVNQNFSVAAKQPASLSLTLTGLVYSDEAGDQSDPGTAW